MRRPGEDVSSKPIIGIARCSSLDDYVASVEQSGGRVRVLDVSESPKRLIGEIHGVLLTGGGDVDPVFYGQDREPSIQDAEPGRDEFEIDLARRAMEADLPLLAICRGAQVLNVAAGGTLVQDIPTAITTGLTHAIARPKNAVAHDVTITPGTKLHRALGGAVSATHTCRVNSRHHQSVARVGQNLASAATASDGIVEAIENTDREFCLGVQWHPENFWRTGEFTPLFDAFVASALARIREV